MRLTSSGKLSISLPTIKNVALALFASRQSSSLFVKELGPSSKVRATYLSAVFSDDLFLDFEAFALAVGVVVAFFVFAL